MAWLTVTPSAAAPRTFWTRGGGTTAPAKTQGQLKPQAK